MTSNARWNRLRDRKAQPKRFGFAKREFRKPWVTREILDKMEERRKYKNMNTDESNRR